MKRIFFTIFAIILAAAPLAAEESDIDTLKQLVIEQSKQIEALQSRVSDLEAALGQKTAAPVVSEAAAPAPEWTDRIKIKGDFRYRHELIDQQNSPKRNRQRIRVRMDVESEVNDETKVGFQFASGSGDPVSTNQTLDGGFATKDLRLDLAYADWRPANAPHMRFIGGKIKNPFFLAGKSELIWDSDLNPEGIFTEYTNDFHQVDVFANFGGFWVEERSATPDSVLWGSQIGFTRKYAGSGNHLSLAIGYFDYIHTENHAPFYDTADSFGNRMDAAGNYASDFNELEIGAEYGFDIHAWPALLSFDYVTNTAASGNDDTGWLIGFAAGKCKAPGSWEFKLNYRRIEADAVLGAYTDSDFRGGGSDGKGFEFGMGYQAAPRTKFDLTFFANDQGLTNKVNYNRLQLDVQYKF